MSDGREKVNASSPSQLPAENDTGVRDAAETRDDPTQAPEAFIAMLRRRYTASDVIDRLQRLRDLRVLVVGDAILDEYHFVRPYGMPLKAPVIATQFLEAETYLGGAFAVANHVAGVCGHVELVTALGAANSREDLIRAGLRPNVTPTFFYRPGAPTMAKRRYLSRFLVQKLFEVSFFDDRPLPDDVDEALARHLAAESPKYDLVLVADFGHGLLSERSIQVLADQAPFLAISTQLNSINFGYHVATKYPRADYVCIDEAEMRMALRDKDSPVDELIAALTKRLSARAVTVTRGHHGSLTCLADGSCVSVPILSRQVVDTVGAGDAYLSITAPCVRMGMPPELVGFIGNVAGGVAVRVVGNKESVGPETLFPFIRTLLE
jgi:bifunctional ADP-heptose synthase (sugar kinase/adenylyltransferase)